LREQLAADGSTMRVTYVPVLGTLRELYVQPRTIERFRRYIAALTGGTDDVVLPIGVANPMAKEHAVAKIDELLSRGAEEIGAQAAREAAARLERVDVDVEIKAAVVLADDVAGGWTNRFTTEAGVRFPSRGALKRPFANALAWTSESPTGDQIRQEVLAAIYRVAYQQCRGLPATLRSMLEQEGLAGVFAGMRPGLDGEELLAARAIAGGRDHDAAPYPETFACLYGDTAAKQLGYRPLGLPPRAGFAVALADALEAGIDPLAVLVVRPGSADEEAKRARQHTPDQHRRQR
jgi:hypothetical protein